MPKLNPEHQIKINKKIVQEILAQYGFKLISFTKAKSGIENTTLLISTDKGKFVLRVYRKDGKQKKDIEQELEFMNFLAQNNLPVPKVFSNNTAELITKYITQNQIWNCILMELREGSHAKKYSTSLISDLAKHQAKMHLLGIKFAKTQTYKPKFPNELREQFFLAKINLKEITKAPIKDLLIKIKKFKIKLDQKLPKGFNHLDFDQDNLLVQKDHLTGILDFDDLKYSPIIVCLTYTMWHILFSTQSPDIMFTYLKEYTKYRKLNRLELNYIKDILLFRNYVISALQIMFYGQNTKVIQKLIKIETIISKLPQKIS